MEASNVGYGQNAVLKSRLIQASNTGRKCLQFWYHMYGSGMGELIVKQTDSKTRFLKTLKTVSGNKGKKWNKQMLEIKSVNTFQVSNSPLFFMMLF